VLVYLEVMLKDSIFVVYACMQRRGLDYPEIMQPTDVW